MGLLYDPPEEICTVCPVTFTGVDPRFKNAPPNDPTTGVKVSSIPVNVRRDELNVGRAKVRPDMPALDGVISTGIA